MAIVPPHPGVIIRKRCLDSFNLSVTEAAEALDVTRQVLTNIVICRCNLTPDLAIRLSKVFGSTPENWMKLQMDYEIGQVRTNNKYTNINTRKIPQKLRIKKDQQL